MTPSSVHVRWWSFWNSVEDLCLRSCISIRCGTGSYTRNAEQQRKIEYIFCTCRQVQTNTNDKQIQNLCQHPNMIAWHWQNNVWYYYVWIGYVTFCLLFRKCIVFSFYIDSYVMCLFFCCCSVRIKWIVKNKQLENVDDKDDENRKMRVAHGWKYYFMRR